MRGAWISFVGRIAAQVIGAGATVAFAILVFHSSPAATAPPAAQPPKPAPIPARDGATVLPFVNASADSGQVLLSQSLQQVISARLVDSGVRVLSTGAATKYQSAPAGEPAARSARFAVEGTVTIAGERARVTVTIIDLASGELRWAKTFESVTADVLAFESAIAGAVSSELVSRGQTPGEPAPISTIPEISRRNADGPDGRR